MSNTKKILTAIAFVIAIATIAISIRECRPSDNTMPYYDYNGCLDFLHENYDFADFMPRKPEYIVIHCTAVPPKVSFTPEKLLAFFYNSNKWDRPGYRHFISRDGTIHTLRAFNGDEYIDYNEMTWGASGYNNISIHISYDGGLDQNMKATDTRTLEQRASLSALVSFYKGLHPTAKVIGHRNLSKKACPSFDAKVEYSSIKAHSDEALDSLFIQ